MSPSSSFAKLMALQEMSTEEAPTDGSTAPTEKVVRFCSLSKPFEPAAAGRAFGGHVYAQAAYAASKTVGKGFCLHNITGSFTLPGRIDIPFTYYVRCVRDGGLYALRSVDVRQAGAICFTCICSFKRPEWDNPYSHQQKVDISQKYHSVLHGKKIEDHPLAPGAEVKWWVEGVKSGEFEEEEFPGVEVRRVDMGAYNDTREVRESPDLYRQLQYFRFIGSPEGADDSTKPSKEEEERDATGEYDNLYACAHLYASDKNSLFVITSALGLEMIVQMASLSHTVVFHGLGEPLRMIDWRSGGERKWFVQEGSTSRSGENRGLHESRIWGPNGTLVATTLQDGMVRVKDKERVGKL